MLPLTLVGAGWGSPDDGYTRYVEVRTVKNNERRFHRRSFAQDLYRYGEDNMTPYFKAVKGWQDATKIKNEVKNSRLSLSVGTRFLKVERSLSIISIRSLASSRVQRCFGNVRL